MSFSRCSAQRHTDVVNASSKLEGMIREEARAPQDCLCPVQTTLITIIRSRCLALVHCLCLQPLLVLYRTSYKWPSPPPRKMRPSGVQAVEHMVTLSDEMLYPGSGTTLNSFSGSVLFPELQHTPSNTICTLISQSFSKPAQWLFVLFP